MSLQEIESKRLELERLTKLAHLLRSVGPEGKAKLLASDAFVTEFDQEKCFAFVVSIDIRKSTDLMLKATEPKHFASFITKLCGRLCDAVLGNNGVFDKFTGDGILAFFLTSTADLTPASLPSVPPKSVMWSSRRSTTGTGSILPLCEAMLG
jgi:class 3 adenylate cyclase